MSTPQDHNYVSAVYSNLIQPIAELYTAMLRCGSGKPNEVQTSPAENGYAISIVALTAFLLEGACGRARYVAGLTQRRSPPDTLRDFGEPDIAEKIEEIFIVRDVVAHGHLWTASISWAEKGLQFQGTPGLLPAYGNKKFKQLVDLKSRTTLRLKLDVFPPRIHRTTATTALKECTNALHHLETKNMRFVYLTPVHVEIGENLIPFYRWARELPLP